jgi:preprotein translocase subunit SecF
MIDFIGKKNWFFAISIIITLIGIVGFFIYGLKMDVQFEGGTIIQLQMKDNDYNVDSVKDLIKDKLKKNADVQSLVTVDSTKSNKKTYMMKVQISKSQKLSSAEINTLMDSIRDSKDFHLDTSVNTSDSVQNIEPSYGNEMRNRGIWAFVIASCLIIAFLALRFRVMGGFAAGVTAVLALIHDAFITLTVYVVFGLPINDSFIAAALTILGYSIHDTIIIFDRIRENSNQMRKSSMEELVNKSINQTLGRSINTVVTVVICILTMYVFAKFYNIVSLAEFTFPLLVGIISGCYSSIFIASPLWVIWKNMVTKNKAAARQSRKKARA